MERLDKIVSKAGAVSRSDARGYILRGFVTVDGNVVRDISFKVDPNSQEISLNSKSLTYKKYCYIIMNKPKGVLSASEDKRAKTVIDILSPELKRRNLFPVGRLDKDTTGLLIITDDGDFAHNLLSPTKKVPKEYLATLDGEIEQRVVDGFTSGLTLKDGTKLSSAVLKKTEKPNVALVQIVEGKYHQIKRMFGLFDLGVNQLKRISFGGLHLPEDLEEGQYREVKEQELKILMSSAGLKERS